MGFKVEQKIGKNVYIYEAESYWDKNKQQSRQRRKYVGKKDLKTGKVVTPQRSNRPKLSKDYGTVYLLERMSKEIGLTKLLKEYFEDDYEKILALVYFMITDRQALYLYKDWVGSTYIGNNVYMTPKDISAFLHKLSECELMRSKFLSTWTKKMGSNGAVVFDITSLSSYGTLNEYVEWGYNRDGEQLPQINLGVVFSEEKRLPLFYKTYQGSIPDVVTLKNMTTEIKAHGISNTLFVLDRGFYSKGNINKILEYKFNFIISASNTSSIINKLLEKQYNNIMSSSAAFLYGKEIVHHVEEDVVIGGNHLKAHIYYSDKRRSDEYNRFMRRLLEIEESIKLKEFKNEESARDFFGTVPSSYTKFFSITTLDGVIKINKNMEKINVRLEKMGTMILLTNTDRDRSSILDLYKRRDGIEKVFDTLKNDLHGNRIRVHSKDSMDGLMFIKFISLILYSQILNTMKEKKLNKKYTVRELLQELKKLKKVEMVNGESYTTEISKKQRDILESFAVPVPL